MSDAAAFKIAASIDGVASSVNSIAISMGVIAMMIMLFVLTRFLHDAADAAKAIEGLKGWIARAADLTWPTSRSAIDRKRAVIEAQVAIMRKRLPNFSAATFGALQGYGSKIDAYDEPTLDRLSADIGRMIRRAKEDAKRRAA